MARQGTGAIETVNLNEAKALLREISSSRDLAIITLLLNTGLFLNEVAELQIDSIDWTEKKLKISGHRNRVLPLTDQTYTALARWSKDRVDSPITHLFTTSKGNLQPLSERSIDHLIRKYATQAKLHRTINAQVLRNTYAIQLCKEKHPSSKLMELLGLTDPDALKRYKDAAEKSQDSPTPEPIKDTRSWTDKTLENIFPTHPKQSKLLQHTDGFWSPNPEEVLFGRSSQLKDLKSQLAHEQSVLLIGPVGIGKTHLLKHMKTVLDNELYIASPSPIKPMLAEIYTACENEKLPSKITTQELISKLTSTIPATRPILLIDNLNKLKLPDMELFLTLLDHFVILAAAEETPAKLNPIWWKFVKQELTPLNEDNSKELIKYLTQNIPTGDADMMENRLLSLSNGVPLAMVDMARQLSHYPVATRDAVRGLYHEAGIKYRYWSGAFIVFWAGIVLFRFIALGTHSFEGYILAGIGSSFLLIVRGMKGRH